MRTVPLGKIIEIYGRIWPFIRALPMLAALPVIVELSQHVAEIELGFYAVGGALPPEATHIRLAFGALKILGLVVTIIVALRWWAFDGDARRALRPSWALGKGLALYVLVEAIGEILSTGLARLGQAAFSPSHAGEIWIGVALALLEIFVSGLWLAWYVGMFVEDRTMTFRRSIRAAGPGIGLVFVYLCAGVVPLMALHYTLGYSSIHQSSALVWSLNVIDAVVVLVLTVAIASSFFTVYRWVSERSNRAFVEGCTRNVQ